jgi:hypothetical protein
MRSLARWTILGLLGTIAWAGPLSAQRARPTFLAHIGFTQSDLVGSEEASELNSRSGFLGGVGLGFPLSSSLGVTIEADYVSKGVDISAEDAQFFGVETRYVDVPLLVKYAFGQEGLSLRPGIFAGPSIGFEVACTAQSEIADANGFYQDIDCPETNPRNKTMFDIVVGGELRYTNIIVALRYMHGLTPVLSDDSAPTLKNRVIAVTLGWLF